MRIASVHYNNENLQEINHITNEGYDLLFDLVSKILFSVQSFVDFSIMLYFE